MASSKTKKSNKNKGSVKKRRTKQVAAQKPNFTNPGNARYPFRKIDDRFHLKLKHILGGVSLISLLAAFEVFSIPAANGLIDVMNLTNNIAGIVWLSVAALSGGAAIILYEEEN